MNQLKIETLPVEALAPYERNTRAHSDEDIAQIARSIQKYGFNDPIGIWSDKNIIVEGHGRLMAAQSLGLTEVPCVRLDHLTDEQRREYGIMHNKTAELSEWDFEALEAELSELDLSDFGLSFDPDEQVEDTEETLLEQVREDDAPPPPNDDPEQGPVKVPTSKRGQIWQLGRHRLMCGDSTEAADVRALMDGATADAVITDPPYNVAIENAQGMRLQNDDMEAEAFFEFLRAAFAQLSAALKPGGAFYVWHASRTASIFEAALAENSLEVRQQIIWVKNALVLGRQDYQWRHEPCQPAGTMVRTPDGEVPIEKLKPGDRVLSWDSYSGAVKGYRNGAYPVLTASRHYDGTLYGVTVGDKRTWTTDNHEFSVRFNPNARKNYCTYLMRRGDRWRVGIARAYDARQFGLKTRFNQEQADEVWLIAMHEDKTAAQVYEQILTVKYGIPYTVWDTSRMAKGAKRTEEQIAQIYDALDADKMREGALRLLHDHHRSERFPFINAESKRARFSTRSTARVAACNLVPELMQVPVPTEPAKQPNFEWQGITEIAHQTEYSGEVYSLGVATHGHYIADGIITHNCWYGWKDGAAHWFTPDRTQTTIQEDQADFSKMPKAELVALLEQIYHPDDGIPTTTIYEAKPLKDEAHPTMKPVRLIAKTMRNSTRPGEVVLDLFGGSGTTMIAAEQMGRTAYLMELDPRYCDVIIERYEKFTGDKARRIR